MREKREGISRRKALQFGAVAGAAAMVGALGSKQAAFASMEGPVLMGIWPPPPLNRWSELHAIFDMPLDPMSVNDTNVTANIIDGPMYPINVTRPIENQIRVSSVNLLPNGVNVRINYSTGIQNMLHQPLVNACYCSAACYDCW